MPVIREQLQVQPQLTSRAPVPRMGQSESRMWSALAEEAGRFSAQMGRLLAETTQDEAVALARQASIGENGVVQFDGDPDKRARMGHLAGRAFDNAVLPRQQQRLANDLGMIINGIRDQYQTDSEGFVTAVSAAVEGMVDTIPPELRGYVEDFVATEIRDTASRIGWQEGQIDRKVEAEEFFVGLSTSADQLFTMAQAGETGNVETETARIKGIADGLLERGIITPLQHDEAMRDIEAATGAAAVLGLIDSENWGEADIRDLQDRLLRGSDPELNAMFRSDGARVAAANRLAGVASLQGSKEREAGAAHEQAMALRTVVVGGAEATASNREVLDAGLADLFGVQAMTPDMWLNGQVNQAAVWDQIRVSGFLPKSLTSAFNVFARGAASEQGRETVYAMWKELSSGRAPDGTPTSLAGDIPQAAVERLELMEVLSEAGYPSETAYSRAGEIIANGVDKEVLAARFNNDRPWLFPRENRSGTTADNVDERLKSAIRDKVNSELNMTLTGTELNRAVRSYSILAAGGNVDGDEAWNMVERGLKARNVETQFIYDPSAGHRARSPWAPERHYAVPKETWLGRVGSALGFGRSWFEEYAESQIRTRIAEGIELPEGDLQPGRGGFYVLEHDPRTTGKPGYYVKADLDGNGVYDNVYDSAGNLLRLDPHGDWLEALGPAQEAELGRAQESADRIQDGIDNPPEFTEPLGP